MDAIPPPNDDSLAAITGAAASLVAMLMGSVNVQQTIDVMYYAGVGAGTGYLVKQLLEAGLKFLLSGKKKK